MGIYVVSKQNEIKYLKQLIRVIIKCNISSAKSLRTPSNVFVINLAFCDFVMMTKAPIFIYNSFHQGYALGHMGCQVFALMGSLSGIGAAISNACIAYDR